MRKLMLAAVAVFALSGCGPTKAEMSRDVEAFGFTEVRLGKWAWFGCSKDDNFAYHFTARNVAGKPVSGIVCAGWLKGATVRIN